VGDPVAELVAGSGWLPAAGSGWKQAVCDKWKIAYRRKLIGGLQAITPITRRGLLVVVGAGNGLADYDVIARPLDKMADDKFPGPDVTPHSRKRCGWAESETSMSRTGGAVCRNQRMLGKTQMRQQCLH